MKQDRELGGLLITVIVIYMIAGAFFSFMTIFPPAGTEPKMAFLIPYLALFLFSISLMKFQSLGYYGLIITQIVLAIMYTAYFHGKPFNMDPLEFVSIMSTKGFTWFMGVSILILWMAVRPIGDKLD